MSAPHAHAEDWQTFRDSRVALPQLDMALDFHGAGLEPDFLARMAPEIERALEEMAALEAGAIANPDEQRQVGHYWLRAPELAPAPDQREAITDALQEVRGFARRIHEGRTAAPDGSRFHAFLGIGIGGSALGPELVSDALGEVTGDRLEAHFIDNTDPDGTARVLARLDGRLSHTLCVVTSKSGGTPETRNGLVQARAAFEGAGLAFPAHAVAITQEGSKLDARAREEGWLARFPMWDWVGGRTSELCAVGLLPAALQGIDIDGLLEGARRCDEATRDRQWRRNPAALLALAWHRATRGRGERQLVVLPYKDRLSLFGRYLQQLIMESLGKRLDRDGEVVEQGLTVYGNKGSTDQHAYVQQLRDGRDDVFVCFVRVLEAGAADLEVEPGITAGDFLHGFLLGTRQALAERGRPTHTITLPRVDALRVGALIALFERTVGLYASLVRINAYHQPGVEAGKRAASSILDLQRRLAAALSDEPRTARELAAAAAAPERSVTAHAILEHLAANGRARPLAAADGVGAPAGEELFARA